MHFCSCVLCKAQCSCVRDTVTGSTYAALKFASQRVHVSTTHASRQTLCSARVARLLGRQHGDDKTDSRGLNVWGNSSALHKLEFPVISQYSFVSMGQSKYDNMNVCSL